jgi:hypothetical protein
VKKLYHRSKGCGSAQLHAPARQGPVIEAPCGLSDGHARFKPAHLQITEPLLRISQLQRAAASQSTKFTVVVCPVLTLAVLLWLVNPVAETVIV